jgi:hypothetical protein
MENSHQDAVYCSYCGSSLQQQNQQGSSFQPPSSKPGSFGMRARSPFEVSERYEKALKRVEQLTYAVLGMSIVLLVLVLI